MEKNVVQILIHIQIKQDLFRGRLDMEFNPDRRWNGSGSYSLKSYGFRSYYKENLVFRSTFSLQTKKYLSWQRSDLELYPTKRIRILVKVMDPNLTTSWKNRDSNPHLAIKKPTYPDLELYLADRIRI